MFRGQVQPRLSFPPSKLITPLHVRPPSFWVPPKVVYSFNFFGTPSCGSPGPPDSGCSSGVPIPGLKEVSSEWSRNTSGEVGVAAGFEFGAGCPRRAVGPSRSPSRSTRRSSRSRRPSPPPPLPGGNSSPIPGAVWEKYRGGVIAPLFPH